MSSKAPPSQAHGSATQADLNHFLQYLGEVEEMAEEILADKQQIIELDRKRNKTREAIRTLQKDKTSQKTWMCFGNMFIKLPKTTTRKMLDKDFDQIEDELNVLRKDLKPKLDKMRDAEHKEKLKGFHLNPLSKEEIRALESLL